MQVSTGAELLGFALLSLAAWMLTPIAGVAVAGCSLLFIGYATDDGAVAVSGRRMVGPFVRFKSKRMEARKLRRETRARRKDGQ